MINKTDLRKELTVFVIYSGEETISECINSLKKQNSLFKLKFIKNIIPMSSAFQFMPENCFTKYFIQVDADMVLYSDSILRLYKLICNTNFLTYRISGQLYEKGFGLGGHVKCWKKSIFKIFKFKDVRTVDRNFHNRVKYFGLRNKVISHVFGIHIPRHSKFSKYLKTKSDIEKWRFLRRPFEKYAEPLMNNLIQNNDLNRLHGLIMGIISPRNRVMSSKNSDYEKKIYIKQEKIINSIITNNSFKLIFNNQNFIILIKKSYSLNKVNFIGYQRELLELYFQNSMISSKEIDNLLISLK